MIENKFFIVKSLIEWSIYSSFNLNEDFFFYLDVMNFFSFFFTDFQLCQLMMEPSDSWTIFKVSSFFLFINNKFEPGRWLVTSLPMWLKSTAIPCKTNLMKLAQQISNFSPAKASGRIKFEIYCGIIFFEICLYREFCL